MRKDVRLLTWVNPVAPEMDLLFVHGLTGDIVRTWQSRDDAGNLGDPWPLWLAPGLPNVAIHSLGYAAPLGRDNGRPKESLTTTAGQSLDLLISRGLGSRPLVVVTHSLGGLLWKRMLSRAQMDVQRTEFRQVADNLKGVFFVATPHDGADLANLAALVMHNHSAYINALRTEGEFLEQLKENYIHYATTNNVVTWSLFEGRALSVRRWPVPWVELSAIVVSENSAYAGIGKKLVIDRDHNEISRATSTADRLFTLVLQEGATILALVKERGSAVAGARSRSTPPPALLDEDELDRLIDAIKRPGDVYEVGDRPS